VDDRQERRLLAVELLLELAALLRLDRERGGGAGEQALDADGLAGLLAEAVAAVLDPGERGVDLLQELPLAVARAKLERMLLLERRAVGRVRRERELAQVLRGGAGVLPELALQLQQALPEDLSCAAFMYSDFGILTSSASVRVFALLAIDPRVGLWPRRGKRPSRRSPKAD